MELATSIISELILTTQAGDNLEFLSRWADIQFDGTIEYLDQCVSAMVEYARMVDESSDSSIVESALDDLECAAYTTARQLRKVFSLRHSRTAVLPIDSGHLLSATVEQYLPYLSKGAYISITAGGRLEQEVKIRVLDPVDLTIEEQNYQDWVMPYAIGHLIPDAYDCEE